RRVRLSASRRNGGSIMNAKPRRIGWGEVAVGAVGISALIGAAWYVARKRTVSSQDAEAFARLVGTVGNCLSSLTKQKAPEPVFLRADEIFCENEYYVLGVTPGATADEIRSAFRTELLKTHPDHGGSVEATRKLIEARDLLLKRFES